MSYENPQSEHEHQVRVVQWARRSVHIHPELRLLYSIPNGGRRPASVARVMSLEGVNAGIPDLCLPIARNGYHALYIEMKSLTVKGDGTSSRQRQMIKLLREAGCLVQVCKGYEAGIRAIQAYLGGLGNGTDSKEAGS